MLASWSWESAVILCGSSIWEYSLRGQHIETRWYWFWRHAEVMEISWGLAPGETRRSYWWSLCNGLNSRTEKVIERSWGLTPWPEPRIGHWWKRGPVTGGTQHFGAASTVGWPPRAIPLVERSGLEPGRYVVCAAEGRTREVTQPFGGHQKMVSEYQTLDSEFFFVLFCFFFLHC